MILSTSAYDPEEEEGRRRPSHFTRKDFKIMSVIGVLVIIILIPVYIYLKQQRDSAICSRNLESIGKAMELYANDFSDRFPPTCFTDSTGEHAQVFNKTEVFSWVSLLSGYMNARSSFVCPSATQEENSFNYNPAGGKDKPKVIESSYGMYAALATQPRGSVQNLSDAALICDSSSNGANGTFDPLPFNGESGEKIRDGFMVGLDNTNFTPSQSSRKIYALSKSPTRLAFIDSAKTGFKEETVTRHPQGIHILMADLHAVTRNGSEVPVRHFGKGDVTGLWTIPY
jgi:hypothetical protein